MANNHLLTYFILQGDFNAHTKNQADFIEYNEFVEGIGAEAYDPMTPRNSEDSRRVDMRGEELIELCKSFNLNILNGRKTGDLFGKITSFQWNGV